MPKLRSLSGREICAILEANGFVFYSQRGSHIKLRAIVNSETLTVIVPAHRTVQTGTMTSIIRQSKLPRELFEA